MSETCTDARPAPASRGIDRSSPRHWISILTLWDVATVVVVVGVAAVALATVRDYALSNDEPVQHRYGELILDYYASDFADKSLFGFKDLFRYGGLFDIIAVALSRVIPIDAYALRHVLCLLFGVGGIAAVTATARMIAGARAGFFAAVALVSCGAWYGAMFNHTKDIPFAAAMAATTLMLIRCARAFPTPRPRDVALLGLAAGAALGLRVLGLLIPFYVAFALLLYSPRSWPFFSRDRLMAVVRGAIALTPALAIAYLVMIAAWPYAALAPLNPLRALLAFSEYNITIRTLLAGKIYDMASVPRYYVPLYFLIRVPLATLVGAVLGIAAAAWPRRDAAGPPDHRLDIVLVALTALFPVACEVASHGPTFTGLRHFTYVLAPLAVLAGIGVDATAAALGRQHRALGPAVVAAVAMLYVWYGSILIRLHPYEYVFYNTLVGGTQGAAARYDMDYWVNSMPEMVRLLEDYLRRTEPAGSRQVYSVGVCGERLSFEKSVTSTQLRWSDMPRWEQVDFFIAPTQMFCDRILGGKVVGTVERMGVAIAYVKDRRALTRPAVAAVH